MHVQSAKKNKIKDACDASLSNSTSNMALGSQRRCLLSPFVKSGRGDEEGMRRGAHSFLRRAGKGRGGASRGEKGMRRG